MAARTTLRLSERLASARGPEERDCRMCSIYPGCADHPTLRAAVGVDAPPAPTPTSQLPAGAYSLTEDPDTDVTSHRPPLRRRAVRPLGRDDDPFVGLY